MATIKDLRSLLGGSRSTRGVVVEVRGESVLIATPSGLREFTGLSGVTTGDLVTIDGANAWKSAKPAFTYWV